MTEKSRGEMICSLAIEQIKDKHVCHVGCGSGEITQELSKIAKRITAIEIVEDKALLAKNKQYHCETKVIHGDAIQYFSDMDSCPDTFYLWAGWKPKEQGIQWWIENIVEFFGKSSPDVICGLSMSEATGHCHYKKHPLQFYSAKVLQKIYNKGEIIQTEYKDEQLGVLPYAIYKINLENVRPTGFKKPVIDKIKNHPPGYSTYEPLRLFVPTMPKTDIWGDEGCPYFHIFEKHYRSFIGEQK